MVILVQEGVAFLGKIAQTIPSRPIHLAGCGCQGKAHTVRSIARAQRLSFPILLDSNGAVASRYGIRAHPIAYLIDIQGDVIGVANGYRKWDREEMKTLIRSLLPKGESKG